MVNFFFLINLLESIIHVVDDAQFKDVPECAMVFPSQQAPVFMGSIWWWRQFFSVHPGGSSMSGNK